MKERLTIGMPVFNDVDFIKESLNSLLNQSFDSFKLIISDGFPINDLFTFLI